MNTIKADPAVTEPCMMRFAANAEKQPKYLLSRQKTNRCTAGNAIRKKDNFDNTTEVFSDAGFFFMSSFGDRLGFQLII
jgi:hypothetical protein